MDPIVANSAALQLTDSLSFDGVTDAVTEMQTDKALTEISAKKMKDFEAEIREKIKDGVIPPAAFSSEIVEAPARRNYRGLFKKTSPHAYCHGYTRH